MNPKRFLPIPVALVAMSFALGVSTIHAKGPKPKPKPECVVGMEGEAECRQAMLIDEGFRIFNEETFDGNGRTCSTCHVPRESYNIFPNTIKKLKRKDRKLVFATNVPGLENADLIKSHALFNISGGADSCGADDPACFDPAVSTEGHSGPIFRSTMGIFGLAATTTASPNFPGTPLFPPECSAGGIAPQLPQLGWSGDGSPGTPNTDVVCTSHHGNFDPAADGSLRAFANGAIAQHSPKSLARISRSKALDEGLPYWDFRFATDDELDAMAALQNWLGRRTLSDEENTVQVTTDALEFDINQLAFKDSRVALGRDHFFGIPELGVGPTPDVPNPNAGAGCDGCHGNAGSNAVFAGAFNININTEVELGSDDIGQAIVGVDLPHDEGASTSFGPPRPPGFEDAFNIQSVVEAAQKRAWFHNHRVIDDFEEAIAFYIHPDFTDNAVAFTTEPTMRNGNASGTISFPNGDGIEHLGAFLRAVNAFYNLRDCERLIDETIQRVEWGISTTVPVQHCEFNLQHVQRVLKESKLKKLHVDVMKGARKAKRRLKTAAKKGKKRNLLNTKAYIRDLRDSIAMQIDVSAP